MEQVAERTATPKYDWRTLEIFDEDGSQIKNPRTLRGMIEAQELIEAWKKRIDSWHLDEILGRHDEEDDGIDPQEENI